MDGDPMNVTLVVGVSNEKNIRELREQLGETKGIEVALWNPYQFSSSAHLDAEYFPITAAADWGAALVIDSAQVLSPPVSVRERLRLPEYVIAGGALSEAPTDNGNVVYLVLRNALRAVIKHNNTPGAAPISRVGFWEGWLKLEEVGAGEIAKCLVQLSRDELTTG
jgi:hypothetical protein